MTLEVESAITLDEPHLLRKAALAGLGLVYLSEYDVEADLAAGRLERVLEDWTPPFDRLALYYPGRRHVPAPLRALIDMIKQVDRKT
ncbi:LysR substrate-binding domain-containing protein [Dyella aluminiiresistens]|uniref:LysR substrate-binding domain-containing protein n=1 Tax=Dyella aluminiiresistens TaxID=3069105 RepID=UPI00399CE692